jgi:hypothetical protein
MMQSQLVNVPFCVAAILLLRRSAAGLYWLAPGFMFSLVAGEANAWVPLVGILEVRRTKALVDGKAGPVLWRSV